MQILTCWRGRIKCGARNNYVRVFCFTSTWTMALFCKPCLRPIEQPDHQSDCGHCVDLPARVLPTCCNVAHGLFGVRPTAASFPSERAGEWVSQPLFCGTQERWGTLPNPRSQAYQQSALQASVQDDNTETDPGANLPWVLVCVHGFKWRTLSHSDSTTSQMLYEVCFWGHGVPLVCSIIWAGFSPTHFLEVHGCSTFPPQSERDVHSQLTGWLADFSSFTGHASQPYRHAASSLGVPRTVCQRSPSVPPWDLEMVLRALSQPPFEPLASIAMKKLSLNHSKLHCFLPSPSLLLLLPCSQWPDMQI